MLCLLKYFKQIEGKMSFLSIESILCGTLRVRATGAGRDCVVDALRFERSLQVRVAAEAPASVRLLVRPASNLYCLTPG